MSNWVFDEWVDRMKQKHPQHSAMIAAFAERAPQYNQGWSYRLEKLNPESPTIHVRCESPSVHPKRQYRFDFHVVLDSLQSDNQFFIRDHEWLFEQLDVVYSLRLTDDDRYKLYCFPECQWAILSAQETILAYQDDPLTMKIMRIARLPQGFYRSWKCQRIPNDFLLYLMRDTFHAFHDRCDIDVRLDCSVPMGKAILFSFMPSIHGSSIYGIRPYHNINLSVEVQDDWENGFSCNLSYAKAGSVARHYFRREEYAIPADKGRMVTDIKELLKLRGEYDKANPYSVMEEIDREEVYRYDDWTVNQIRSGKESNE